MTLVLKGVVINIIANSTFYLFISKFKKIKCCLMEYDFSAYVQLQKNKENYISGGSCKGGNVVFEGYSEAKFCLVFVIESFINLLFWFTVQ